MASRHAEELARRAGVDVAFVERLVDVGILPPDEKAGSADADARLVRLIDMLAGAGIPIEGLGIAVRDGDLSLDFVDSATYERFASFSDVTFGELAEQTGVPLETLTAIREAAGSALPDATDRVREDELLVVPLVRLQHRLGFRPAVIERALRVSGESLRRVAETEADWWHTEIVEPRLRRGGGWAEVGAFAGHASEELAKVSDNAILAIYHARQTRAWLANFLEGIEANLAAAGLQAPVDRAPPAIAFLDITGYTRLTEEHGDEAAAQLAERLSRIVERTAIQFGGRPVKWLGDSMMFHFPEPAEAVLASLEMVDAASAADLPPARVGLHAGPVLFQEGDYFGRTVNVASRIADQARPGEVVVSGDMAALCRNRGVSFDPIGEARLKGVTEPVPLFRASAAPDSGSRRRGAFTTP